MAPHGTVLAAAAVESLVGRDPMKLRHEQVQYVEFLSRDLQAIKRFYVDANQRRGVCYVWRQERTGRRVSVN